MNQSTAHDVTLPDDKSEDGELEVVAIGWEQSRSTGAIVAVKFDSASIRLVQQAAASEGLTQAEFVRRAALDTARKAINHST
jgi:hypothetical protein